MYIWDHFSMQKYDPATCARQKKLIMYIWDNFSLLKYDLPPPLLAERSICICDHFSTLKCVSPYGCEGSSLMLRYDPISSLRKGGIFFLNVET
jgi:hypothetical protein